MQFTGHVWHAQCCVANHAILDHFIYRNILYTAITSITSAIGEGRKLGILCWKTIQFITKCCQTGTNIMKHIWQIFDIYSSCHGTERREEIIYIYDIWYYCITASKQGCIVCNASMVIYVCHPSGAHHRHHPTVRIHIDVYEAFAESMCIIYIHKYIYENVYNSCV